MNVFNNNQSVIIRVQFGKRTWMDNTFTLKKSVYTINNYLPPILRYGFPWNQVQLLPCFTVVVHVPQPLSPCPGFFVKSPVSRNSGMSSGKSIFSLHPTSYHGPGEAGFGLDAVPHCSYIAVRAHFLSSTYYISVWRAGQVYSGGSICLD